MPLRYVEPVPRASFWHLCRKLCRKLCRIFASSDKDGRQSFRQRSSWDRLSTAPTSRDLQTRLLALLFGLTLAVFGGVCGHEFVHYDDNFNIYGNPHIQGLTWEHLKWMFTSNGYAPRYMPLGWLSYAVDYQLFGLNPQAFHCVNL